MADNQEYDMGATDAPDNKEKEYVKPGYRKLTVNKFEYTPEEPGKTPLIKLFATGKNDAGEDIEFTERLYISGKLNKDKVMSAVVRLQELYKGLTGNPKMTLKPTLYNYTKDNTDGSKTSFAIPNPKELCDYLNTTCSGKTAIFKIGGEETAEGKIFAKFTYSGFLYYTDKQGSLCRYKEEGDFSDNEYKFAVQKRKGEGAPAHGGGIAAPSQLDEL